MTPKPPQCDGCPLQNIGAGFTRIDGKGALQILIVGEASGENESLDSLPFRPYAQAGSQLERILELARSTREQFWITNILRCRPPRDKLAGAPYEHAAIAHCTRSYLFPLLEKLQPRSILALGDIAFRTLTGLTGKKLSISKTRGYPIRTPWGLVVGSYHPSFIKRGMANLTSVSVFDVQQAIRYSKVGRDWEPLPVSYQTIPSVEDAEEFAREVESNPSLPLYFDIETATIEDDEEEMLGITDNQEIVTVQFSLRPQTAINIPYLGAFKGAIDRCLHAPNEKVGQNCWRFDVPRLAHHGHPVTPPVQDLMWAFHQLQSDLKGHYNLQSIASFYGMDRLWKHLSASDPAFYGCVDVDAPARIWPQLVKQMKQMGVWQSYLDQKVRLEPSLINMSRRGLPLNMGGRDRLNRTLARYLRQIDRRMQSLYPDCLRSCTPPEGYVRAPSSVEGMVEREFEVKVPVREMVLKPCTCKAGRLRKEEDT